MDSTLTRPPETGRSLPEQSASSTAHAAPEHMHTLTSLRREARQKIESARSNIREHPRQATLLALAGGMLLSFLPLSAIVTAALRVLLFLAKPVLLILGGIKIVEEYKKSRPHP